MCRSGEGPGVIVGGATVEIDVAVTQEDARAMASAKAGKAGKTGPQDKRNLYLVRKPQNKKFWQPMYIAIVTHPLIGKRISLQGAVSKRHLYCKNLYHPSNDHLVRSMVESQGLSRYKCNRYDACLPVYFLRACRRSNSRGLGFPPKTGMCRPRKGSLRRAQPSGKRCRRVTRKNGLAHTKRRPQNSGAQIFAFPQHVSVCATCPTP